MLQNINFKTTRAIHICIVLTATIAIQEFFNYPRSAWTGFAVMMIYIGFDAGATIQRTFHRFWGATLGLLLSLILWFIGHIDYRLLFLIIPVIIFFAYYSLGKFYMFPTIFTVTLTALGTDYYSTDGYPPTWFFSDYFICTVIALIICVSFEYFIFRHKNLTHKFYYDLQEEIIQGLQNLYAVVLHKNINKSQVLKKTVYINTKVLEFNNFLNNTRHDYHTRDNLLAELELFMDKAKHTYQNLRQLIIAPITMDTTNIKQNTAQLIDELNKMSKAIKRGANA